MDISGVLNEMKRKTVATLKKEYKKELRTETDPQKRSILMRCLEILSMKFKTLLWSLTIGLFLISFGYSLRMSHEYKNMKFYQSQAEKDIWTLEQEFDSAWEMPRKFLIFNRRFEIYPIKADRPTFYYQLAGAGDNTRQSK